MGEKYRRGVATVWCIFFLDGTTIYTSQSLTKYEGGRIARLCSVGLAATGRGSA